MQVPVGPTIALESAPRAILRHALIKHRLRHELNEAEYVKSVLKIALNTYKKCVAVEDAALILKRGTLMSLLKATRLAPVALGLDIEMPSIVEQFGNYDPHNFAYLVGTYFLHRRSFQSANNIVRGVLEIHIDEQKRCLCFEEYNNYLSDGGMPDQNRYTGDIHVDEERSVFSFLALVAGKPRLMTTQGAVWDNIGTAASLDRGGIRLRGALLAHGRGRGVSQPTITAVALESLHNREWKQARTKCRTITPDDAEFALAERELIYAEDLSTVMTPMIHVRRSIQQTSR